MSLIGFVDTLTEGCISGWIADDSDLQRQLDVDIFINDRLAATVRGAAFRDDLRQAGIGDGCKGFQFDPRPYLKPGRNEVEVRHGSADLRVARGRGCLFEGSIDDLSLETNPAGGPILAHIHVPKCAGTSFRILLESHFGESHMRLYVEDPDYTYTHEALRACLLRDPNVRAISTHNVRVFPSHLGGREMLYVTFLRDPVQQFVSYMTHKQKHYAGIQSERLRQVIPPDAPDLSLREFARWILMHEKDIPFRRNYNVNFFAEHNAPSGSNRLDAAKRILSSFFFVGITERMDEGVRKLKRLVESIGMDFPAAPLKVENTSGEYRNDLTWIHPDDEVGSMLLQSVEEDQQLYDWANGSRI